MKIVRIEAIPLWIPVNFSSIGVDHEEFTSFTYVEVETDSGLIGHGLTSITQALPVAETVNSVLGPAILGLDALAHERVWHVMFWTATPWAQSGYASHAISAIDLALWDIKGQAFGQPVWRLIGGARDRVPVYATCGFSFLDDDQLSDVAKKVAEQGFKGLKIQVGRPGLDTRRNSPPLVEIIARDARRIRGVRDVVGPDVEIAIDAGCRLDLPNAVALCRLVEDQNIVFFEEPIVQNDIRLLAELRQKTPIPLTAGQNEGLAYRFRDMLLAGAIDVIQPNVIITGGLTQCLRIAGMAASFNVPISNGGGAPFQNCHLQAGVQNGTAVEWQFNTVLACIEIYKDLPSHEDGWIIMPETPGLGLTVDRTAVDCLIYAG
ncbi:mandelate racemase/muconate lactonizing enzyme family protein [Alphaproteobacteria bacterium]|nr:mandelate racemase/muconate lactonizing enzyme family protein [Alphaproteobacteria bacterium]